MTSLVARPDPTRRNVMLLAASGVALALPRAAAAIPEAPPLYMTAPQPMPALQFSDAAGHRLSLASFHGRFVLLNIWATWCIPCRKEMPTLDRLQTTLGSPRFEVVPLSIDAGGRAAVETFYAKVGVRHLGSFLDPSGSAMQLLDLEGLPTSFLIDPDGRRIGRETGAVVWDTPAVIAFLKHRIAQGR